MDVSSQIGVKRFGGAQMRSKQVSGALTMHLMIVDDHPLYREALQSALVMAFPFARVDEADSINSAIDKLARLRSIDMILLDLSMQGVTGFDGLVAIRKSCPSIPVLIVSGLDDVSVIQDAMRYGASGFVPKAVDKPRLIEAITTVLKGSLAFPRFAGSSPVRGDAKTSLMDRIALLTPQQLRVMMMIRQGKLNKQIAHELSVGDSTVKAHVTEILRKLGVASRTQIVIETARLNFDRSN